MSNDASTATDRQPIQSPGNSGETPFPDAVTQIIAASSALSKTVVLIVFGGVRSGCAGMAAQAPSPS